MAMLRILMVSILMMGSASAAFGAQTEMKTFKGNVAILSIAQIMANRYKEPVTITKAQITSAEKSKKKQSFAFSAVIGGPEGKHEARCAFIRTMGGDGIACR